MRHLLKLIIIIVLFLCPNCGETTTLTGGISMTDRIAEGFFGSWKVMAVRVQTTREEMFAPYSVEIWNLSKSNDVITLTNPISGASASITVKDAEGDTFTFQRVTGDRAETVTETAKLTLNGNSFIGSDTMVVRYYKNGYTVRTENVEYKIKAYKISGNSINDIFGVK